MNVFLHPRFDAAYHAHPLTLVDAGARGGVKKNWLPAREHLRTIGFEPDPEEYQRLVAQGAASGRDLILGVALHSRRDTLTLHVARDRGLTSCFPPNRAFLEAFPDAARFDTTARQQIAADALDDVLAQHGIEDVDFVKADTQGSELSVLKGGEGTLRRSAVGVEVEVEFSPIYEGQPLFADVDVFLRGLGFQLFDLRPCYWKRAAGRHLGGPYGQIIWADALYFKPPARLADQASALDAQRQKSKLLKAISVVLLYGYFDAAVEIVRAAGSRFDEEERRLILAALEREGRRRGLLPPFPGKPRLAAALRRLARLLTDRPDGWSVGDGQTGNIPGRS